MGTSFSNKYLYSSYKNILLGNEILFFCELNDVIAFKKLKKESAKNGFSVTSIKSKVFKSFLKDKSLGSKFYNLFHGPVFILYKKNLNPLKDIHIIKNFINHKFILCCLVNNKLYGPSFLNVFSLVKPKMSFYVKILNDFSFLSIKLNNLIKQL